MVKSGMARAMMFVPYSVVSVSGRNVPRLSRGDVHSFVASWESMTGSTASDALALRPAWKWNSVRARRYNASLPTAVGHRRAAAPLMMAVDEKETKEEKDTSTTNSRQPEGKEMNKAEQAKQLAITYGPAFFVTSAGSSIVSISAWYLIVRSGVDVAATMQGVGDFLGTTPIGRPQVLDRISPEMSAFALAYIAHKATSPLRFPLVVAAVPFVAKLIGKKGATPS